MEIGIGKVKNVCSTVRKNFPYESPWVQRHIKYRELIEQYKKNSNTKDLIDLQKMLVAKESLLKQVRDLYNRYLLESSFDYFRELIRAVHKYKIMNCGEHARIAYAVGRMNGFTNSEMELALLTTKQTKDYSKAMFPDINKFFDLLKEFEDGGEYKILDHVALQVHGKKGKEFILDSLLNECHSKENAEIKYKTQYSDALQLDLKDNLQIITGYSSTTSIPNLSNDEAKELMEIYPELKIGAKPIEVKKKNKFFFNLFELFDK